MKSSIEKGKVKLRRKSAMKKEKPAKKLKETQSAGKKSIKTKKVTGKRKRNAQHEPKMEKERTKKKTKKPRNADDIHCRIYSDVEEVTLSGSIPSSALEVDKNGVSASLLSSSTLQQHSTSLIPYYCPQFHAEEPIILEGEGTHNIVENVQSNQSFLALMLE
ncbi:hypothetical protein MKW92_044874 [Papaver armeniacum]|nr:hypothetical protein MKW92_044874 [Papaver armeniacum]